MAVYYVDTSAIAKLYVTEAGSGWMRGIADPAAGHSLYTVRLTAPDLVAAVSRRSRGGSIPPSHARRAVAVFRYDWQRRYLVIEADIPLIDLATDLAETHGLRGYDAVHLAAAMTLHRQRRADALPDITLLSADQEQLRAAAAGGLLIDDPSRHP